MGRHGPSLDAALRGIGRQIRHGFAPESIAPLCHGLCHVSEESGQPTTLLVVDLCVLTAVN